MTAETMSCRKNNKTNKHTQKTQTTKTKQKTNKQTNKHIKCGHNCGGGGVIHFRFKLENHARTQKTSKKIVFGVFVRDTGVSRLDG